LAEIVELGRGEFDGNWLAVSAVSYELAIISESGFQIQIGEDRQRRSPGASRVRVPAR